MTTLLSMRSGRDDVERRLQAMEQLQAHRGPDGRGVFVDVVAGMVAGIGQQRLAINDLSEHAAQPMTSTCGRWVLSFNGEVYNYRELAAELAGDPNLGISVGDTAVVLAAFNRWGTECFRRFNGMWAIVVLDRHQGLLHASRDRFGVKPLYWELAEGELVLASELKALLGARGARRSINRAVASRYLLQSLTNTDDQSFIDGVRQVAPGSCHSFRLGPKGPEALRIERWWALPDLASEGPQKRADPGELRELICDAVRLRLRSDVPVGILLSGGLDSSSLVGAATAASQGAELRALAVVSDDPETSEEPFIDAVVAHTGCAITKVRIDADPAAVLAGLDGACWHADQPVGGFSAVAHRMMMRRAREQGLTVLLTGQGADEQLAGYNKFLYFHLQHELRRGNLLGMAATLMGTLRQGTILREFRWDEARRYLPGRRASGFSACLGAGIDPGALVDVSLGEGLRQRQRSDLFRFSVPMLLHYEDRMSMAESREVREPFLDYRLVEWLDRVPFSQKLESGWTKAILRKAMVGLMPEAVRWRKDKKGFSLPEQAWMRGPYRDAVLARFGDDMVAARLGLLEPRALRAAYDRWRAGDSAVTYKNIFNAYCLETWLRQFARWL